jgi:O-antigen/teichoic acid export membrane protein
MMRFGGSSQLAILVGSFSAYFFRLIITALLGLSGAGQLGAALTLGGYVMLLQLALATYYFPRMSSIYKDPEAMRSEVGSLLRWILLLTIPACVALLLVPELVVRILLTEQFMSITRLLVWILAARVLELLQSVVIAPLLVMGRYRIYIAVISLSHVLLLALTLALVPRLGLLGAAIAQTISYGALFLSSLAVAHRVYGLGVRPRLILTLASGMILVAGAGLALQVSIPVRMLAVPLLAVWVFSFVTRSEWRGARGLVVQSLRKKHGRGNADSV